MTSRGTSWLWLPVLFAALAAASPARAQVAPRLDAAQGAGAANAEQALQPLDGTYARAIELPGAPAVRPGSGGLR